MPRKYSGRGFWLGVAAALVFLPLACGEKNVYAPPPAPKVTVSQPIKKSVTDYLEFTGNAAAINTVPLRARVEGYLEKVLFRDGDMVKKGQLLFLIQQNTYEAKLQQAEAQVLSEKAQLEHAETEFVRYSALLKEDAAAQTEVDRWKYERDSRRAGLMAAKAQVALAKLNLSYTRITAPFDGRIGRRLKDPGTLVGAGEATQLAEVNQIDPIYVYFNINEADLLRVRGKNPKPPRGEGQDEEIPAFVGLADETGYPHKGTLDFAGISLNATTGTLQLRATVPNEKTIILPGMFVKVRVPLSETKEALLVPEVAIGFDQAGSFVRLVNDKNVVEPRLVKLGVQEDGLRVVLSGLQGDEWVVVSGLLRAIPGRQVTPERKAAPSGPHGTNPSEPGPGAKQAAP